MLFLFHMPIFQQQFEPYLQQALPLFKAFLGSYTLVDAFQVGSYSHRPTLIWTNFIMPPRLFASLPQAATVFHNPLSSMVDHNHGGQPVDVPVENNYPFPVNTPGFERKAFAMLTPFVDDEKTVVKGRPRQNSSNGAVTHVSPRAYEWERVMG